MRWYQPQDSLVYILRFLFDRAVTASIDVQGAQGECVEQSNSNIWPLFVCDMPLLEEGWSVGWAKNRFTNSTRECPGMPY